MSMLGAILFQGCDPFGDLLHTGWERRRAMPQQAKKNRVRPTPSTGAAANATPADDVHASDPAAVRFFSAPPVVYEEEPAETVDALPEPHARRMPANPERRRRLTRVVVGAVSLSCAICVAAAVRVATVHAATASMGPATELAHVSPPVPAVAEPVSARSPAAPPPRVEPAPQTLPVVEAPRAAEAPPATEAPVVATATAAPAVAPAPIAAADQAEAEKASSEIDPAAARDAKRTSQRALDRGDAKASIEAGEQSVALDPTDAEAWLILGAAYQVRGTYSEARRCFSTCVRVAKRGPRGECGALLR